MKTIVSQLHAHRPYRSESLGRLLSRLMVNSLFKRKWIVENIGSIHGSIGWIGGTNFANWVLHKSIGKIFVDASSLKQMQQVVKDNDQPFFLGYYPSRLCEGLFDEWHIKTNYHKIEFLNQLHQSASRPTLTLRLSTLMHYSLLQKYARSIQLRDRIWNQYSRDGWITAEALFQAYQAVHPGLTDEDLESHLRLIHGWDGQDMRQCKISHQDFYRNQKTYYFTEAQKNTDLIRRILFPLDANGELQIKGLMQRVQTLIKQPGLRVVFEDEADSETQRAISEILEQFQSQFNNHEARIVKTVNVGSASAAQAVRQIIRNSNQSKKVIGINLTVRGTVLDQTKDELKNVMKELAQSEIKYKIILSCYDYPSAAEIIEILQNSPVAIDLELSVNRGESDHLASWLKQLNHPVSTQVRWVQDESLRPYIAEVATRMNEDRNQLTLRNLLVRQELRSRLVGP